MSWLCEHLFSLVKAFWKLGFNCIWLVSTEAFYSYWFLIGLSRGSFTLIGYSMFATGFEFHLIGQPGSKSGLSWNCEVLNEIQEKVFKMLLLKWMIHDSHAAVAVQQMLDNVSCDFKRWNVPFNMLNRARCWTKILQLEVRLQPIVPMFNICWSTRNGTTLKRVSFA